MTMPSMAKLLASTVCSGCGGQDFRLRRASFPEIAFVILSQMDLILGSLSGLSFVEAQT